MASFRRSEWMSVVAAVLSGDDDKPRAGRPIRQTYVRTACRHRSIDLLTSYKRTTNECSRGSAMSVLATAKPRRSGRPGRAGAGPRRLDTRRRAHMMLLPEYRENAANERDSAPAAGAAARG